MKFLILWPQIFLTLLKIKQNAPYYIKNLEILNDRIFSLFKNFEENLYISHTMHYKSWRFKCFISWKLVWWLEIQWQIILVWNVGLYLKECKISSKNVLFLPCKNCRQLNLLTISPTKESFPLQTLCLPVLISFIQCLIKKIEKCGHFSWNWQKRIYVRVFLNP